jgi:hypothetical protein
VVVEKAMGRLTKPLCSNLLPLIFLRTGDKIFVTSKSFEEIPEGIFARCIKSAVVPDFSLLRCRGKAQPPKKRVTNE